LCNRRRGAALLRILDDTVEESPGGGDVRGHQQQHRQVFEGKKLCERVHQQRQPAVIRIAFRWPQRQHH
jgi:hypothetical protein